MTVDAILVVKPDARSLSLYSTASGSPFWAGFILCLLQLAPTTTTEGAIVHMVRIIGSNASCARVRYPLSPHLDPTAAAGNEHFVQKSWVRVPVVPDMLFLHF